MQLCKLLGIVDRDVLRRTLTHKAYVEWLELWECDPWGEDRADLRSGIVASACVAPWSKKGKTPKPVDFMPYAKRRAPKRQSTEEMRKSWDAINTMLQRGKKK